jgi:hypothetical protein
MLRRFGGRSRLSTTHFKMSTTTTTITGPPSSLNTETLQSTNKDAPFNGFHDDLTRDGYAVIKGAVTADRAAGYLDDIYGWLEGL